MREIIERHELTHNNIRIRKYKFFFAACANERITEGIIQCLLEYFPDAASAANDGWSPLHFACFNENVTKGKVQLLIAAAPDSVRSVTNNYGHLPIHAICNNGKVDKGTAIQILKLLIEKCPEAIRDTSNDGGLPIHYASCWGRSPEFCRVLIEAYPGSERISVPKVRCLFIKHVQKAVRKR